MPAKTTPRAKPATARSTAAVRSSAPSPFTSRAQATQHTSEGIASDLAAFKKAGGRIEVLGNTPLRASYSGYRARTDGAAAAPAQASKPANGKARS